MNRSCSKSFATLVTLLFAIITLLPFSLQAEREKIVISQFGKAKFLLYLPLYLAVEQGYFAKRGIDVTFAFAGNDDQVFATLVSGSAQFAVGDPVFTAIAAERGFGAKTVAQMIRKLAVFGYTETSTIPQIRSIGDLAGLRVGSFPAPSTTYTMLKQLSQKITTGKPLQIVEGAHGTQAPMLKAGLIDIGIDLEPAVSIMEGQGARVVLDLTQFTEPQVITGIMTTDHLIATNPSLVSRVVAALNEALADLSRSRAAAYRTARTLYPELAEGITRRAIDRVLDSGCYPSNTLISDELWQRTLKTRLDSGELRSPQKTPTAVENHFSELALREGV